MTEIADDVIGVAGVCRPLHSLQHSGVKAVLPTRVCDFRPATGDPVPAQTGPGLDILLHTIAGALIQGAKRVASTVLCFQ